MIIAIDRQLVFDRKIELTTRDFAETDAAVDFLPGSRRMDKAVVIIYISLLLKPRNMEVVVLPVSGIGVYFKFVTLCPWASRRWEFIAAQVCALQLSVQDGTLKQDCNPDFSLAAPLSGRVT